jgi:heme/copper-type cytochrome/quinol oxidase subunit 3
MSDVVQPTANRALRRAFTLEALPDVVFGSRNMVWWGTLGFIVIEAYGLLICVAAYFYLRQNYYAWPPYRIAEPKLILPNIQLAVMLLSLVPAYLMDRAAKRFDGGAVRVLLLVCIAFLIAICALRWFEFGAINTRWDTTAYGSIQWFTVGFHATLLVLEFGEAVGLALILFVGTPPAKIMADVSDVSFYWYFMILGWVPLWFIVYILPHLTR